MWEPLSERRLVVSTENVNELAAGTAAPTFQFLFSREFSEENFQRS
jgi:hypothetical protein